MEDAGLKSLSVRVVRAASTNDEEANLMRAFVLSGQSFGSWEEGSRSAAELKEAATHFERAAALCDAPALKGGHAHKADRCRSQAAAM